VRCRKLIDGRGAQPIENALVVIDGSRIVHVGSEKSVGLPQGNYEELDCSEMTVLPGLIDPHLHLALGPGSNYDEMFQCSDGLQLSSGIVNAQMTLESGVTTVRDCGCRNRIMLDVRAAGQRDIISAPRLLVSGPPITMTGGHFYFCNAEADGSEAVRRLTRQLLKNGVDFIKLMASGGGTSATRRELASYTAEELKAAVEETHRQGKTVAAHCHATEAIVNATEAGVDTIEHCTFVEPHGKGRRHVFREDLAAEMVRKGIYADNVFVTTPDRERLEWSFENFRRLRKAGVKILPGTDGLRLYETASLALVLEMMVRAGASPMEAILSATSLAAKALNMDTIVGTVEVGKEADLIAVQGDPLEDIRVLKTPRLVIKAGNTVPPSGRTEARVRADALAQKVLSILNESGIS